MKKLFFVFMLLALVACAGTLPPEAQKIASVSDTSKCTFIKNDVVDTIQPYKQIILYNVLHIMLAVILIKFYQQVIMLFRV